MSFFRENEKLDRYVDKIFPVVQAAKKDLDEATINATAGCLYDESGKLFTYSTVFENEKKLSDANKASYASSPAGNADYCKAIEKYILEDRVTNSHQTMATVGGTGALYTSIKLCLEAYDTILYPEISWGNYKNITEEFNLIGVTYNVYDLNDLFTKIDQVEGKVFVLINSPCENPLGFSYTYEQWQSIINHVNSLDKEVVLLLDIAYIDYATNDPKGFFKLFNEINDNVLVLIAASTSKSFSYYGVRLGALIAIHNDINIVDSFMNYGSRLARTTWSNPNNGAMMNIADVLNNHYEEYIKERDESIEMLKKRTTLFKLEAKENGLEIYPHEDGFFVTIKIEDNELKNQIHQRLMDNHIYTIAVNKGIRIALCSVPLNKVYGLAKRIKELM